MSKPDENIPSSPVLAIEFLIALPIATSSGFNGCKGSTGVRLILPPPFAFKVLIINVARSIALSTASVGDSFKVFAVASAACAFLLAKVFCSLPSNKSFLSAIFLFKCPPAPPNTAPTVALSATSLTRSPLEYS